MSRAELATATKLEIGKALRHESLPCPARGLELVVYAETRIREPALGAAYELDLNSGPRMPYRLSLDPTEAVAHWYPIDRAILREHGVVLLGPPPRKLFAPLPRAVLLGLLADAVRWHEENASAVPQDAVLNACRAWRFAADGVWSSKVAAGEWARERLSDATVVTEALAARRGGPPPHRARAAAFPAQVRLWLDAEGLSGELSRS